MRLLPDGLKDSSFGNEGNVLIGPDPIHAGFAAPFSVVRTGDVELSATVNTQPSLVRYAAYTPVSPTVTGVVYSDAVGAGQFSAVQAGVAGQVIYADLNDNGKLDPGEPMAVTNSQGNYTLSNLPAGSLIIRQVLQSGQPGRTRFGLCRRRLPGVNRR